VNAYVLVFNRHEHENEMLRSLMREWEGVEALFFTQVDPFKAWLERCTHSVTAVLLGSQDLSLWRHLRDIPSTKGARFYALGHPTTEPLLDLSPAADGLVVHPFAVTQLEEKIAPLVPVTQRKTALLVDETSEGRDAICRALGSLGFLTVFQADDAQSARDLLVGKRCVPSIILTSCELPFRSYLEMRTELSKTPRPTAMPLLLLTSRASLEQWLEADELRRAFEGRWLGWPTEETRRGFQERLLTELLRHRQVEAFLTEAGIFKSRRMYSHAVDLLKHAVKLFPMELSLYEAMADMHLADFERTDYLEQAAASLENALKVRPDARSAVLRAAGIWAKLDRWSEAARVLQRHVLRFPFDDSTRTLLAQVYLKMNDRTGAMMELRRVVVINRSNHEATQLKLSLEASDPAAGLFSTHRITAR